MESLLLGMVRGHLWQGDVAGTPSCPSTARRGQAGSAAGLQEGNQSLVGRCLVDKQGFSTHLADTEVSGSPRTHFSILPLAPCSVPQLATAHPLHPTFQGRSLHQEPAQHPDPAWLFPPVCSEVPAVPWKPSPLLRSPEDGVAILLHLHSARTWNLGSFNLGKGGTAHGEALLGC